MKLFSEREKIFLFLNFLSKKYFSRLAEVTDKWEQNHVTSTSLQRVRCFHYRRSILWSGIARSAWKAEGTKDWKIVTAVAS